MTPDRALVGMPARRRATGLTALVTNTPLLAIRYTWRGRPRTIYAKCEHLNFTGSIKDRMALHILEHAYASGRLSPGDTIIEATSGNTGISFAALGRALGHPVTIFMPNWMSRERVDLIASFGARIVLVSREEGGFLGSIAMAREAALRDPRTFLPEQFANAANPAAHAMTTGPEIVAQLAAVGLAPDAFVAGVGTGGTVMGVGQALRRCYSTVRIHPLEPASSPTLTTGCKVGQHRIQGISDEFIPPVVDLSALDDIISAHDGDAILLSQRMASELGLGVGISSGANLAGAIALQNRMGDDAVVVTVFPDSNKKYLTTDLVRQEPIRDGYMSPEVEFLGFTALPRVCAACP
jgi:cysteine synthase